MRYLQARSNSTEKIWLLFDWAYTHDPQITKGTSKTKFSPNKTVTRAQAATFLWRAAGCPTPKTTENPFTDVAADAYYYEAVLWAVEEGIRTAPARPSSARRRPATSSRSSPSSIASSMSPT